MITFAPLNARTLAVSFPMPFVAPACQQVKSTVMPPRFWTDYTTGWLVNHDSSIILFRKLCSKMEQLWKQYCFAQFIALIEPATTSSWKIEQYSMT
jgi:hypothetical protein